MGIESFDGVLSCRKCGANLKVCDLGRCATCKATDEREAKKVAMKIKLGEEYCANRDDHQHCHCWYDGEKCCACDAPAMSDDQKREQGMIN